MTRINLSQVIRAIILSSLAALMVGGFLVLGGLGSGDSAEAFRCNKRWFDRCPSITTSSTFDGSISTTLSITTTFIDSALTTSGGDNGFFSCNKRWFDRCSDSTMTISTLTIVSD